MNVRQLAVSIACAFSALAITATTAEARPHRNSVHLDKAVPLDHWTPDQYWSPYRFAIAPATRTPRRKARRVARIHRHKVRQVRRVRAAEVRRAAVRQNHLAAVVVPLPRLRPVPPSIEAGEAVSADRLWTIQEIVAGIFDPQGAERVVSKKSFAGEHGESVVERAAKTGLGIFNVIKDYVASLLRPAARCWEWESVDWQVRKVLTDAAQHFGGPVLMTSCYRSAAYNREVYRRLGRRPTRSQHILRKAIDGSIAGVSSTQLATFARQHPLMRNRGGIGRYAGTNMVHIDSGPKREWCWCGKKRNRVRMASR